MYYRSFQNGRWHKLIYFAEHFNGDCCLDIPEMLFTSIFFQVQTNNLYFYAALLGATHYY